MIKSRFETMENKDEVQDLILNSTCRQMDFEENENENEEKLYRI